MEKKSKRSIGRILTLGILLALSAGCGAINNDDDTSTDTQGNGSSDDGNLTRGGEVTIYDIQQGKVLAGAEITLEGVVATSGLTFDGGGMFVQDPKGGEWSGVYLYLFDEVSEAISPEPGDVINLTGVYEEFYDITQIKVTSPGSIEIIDRVNAPEPMLVASSEIGTGGARAEALEGVLVKVENVEVSKADLGYGEFEVDSVLRVDDIFFTQNSAPKPNVGTTYTSITGPLHYGYEQYKIEPRSLDDFAGGEGGTGGDSDSAEATIYDLQQGKVDTGKIVTLKDVVVTSPVGFDGKGFYVQEKNGGPFSGIYVYAYDEVIETHNTKPGDVLEITGEYTEFYDLSELKVQSANNLKITGTIDVPAPQVVAAADIATNGSLAEDYEGVLVQVENVSVTDDTREYGEWEVNSTLVIDDYFFEKNTAPKPAKGDEFKKIIGPLTYSYSEFKILPRSLEDLVAK